MALEQKQSQEPISKAQALEFFVSSIRDPHNPRHCAVCLDGAFRQCTDSEKLTHLIFLRRLTTKGSKGISKYNPELWDAVVKFLFIKRTKKQMRRLLVRLSECTCRMDQQGGNVEQYHQISTQGYTVTELDRTYNQYLEHKSDEDKKFNEIWRSFLSNLISNLSVPINLCGLRSSGKGSSISWPQSSMDLVPYGADCLVESILQWHQMFHDPLLFSLMGGILQISRELVIPSLVKYGFMEKVIDSTRQVLDRINMYRQTDHNPNPSAKDYALQVFGWQVAHVLHYLITCLFGLIHDDHKQALYQNCEMKALQLCSLVLYTPQLGQNRDGIPDETVKISNQLIFVDIGRGLFHFFHTHIPSRPSIPIHPLIKNFQGGLLRLPGRGHWTISLKVLNVLRTCHSDLRCSARGCMDSLYTVGNEFRRCRKCGIAAYCGRDCQKKAWKDEHYPHKRLCPIFAKLVCEAGPTAFLAIIRDSPDSPNVTQALETILSNWSDAQVDDDLKLVADWQDALNASRGYTLQSEKELNPGFPDYDDFIAFLSSAEGAPEPVYWDRLAESPTERDVLSKLLTRI